MMGTNRTKKKKAKGDNVPEAQEKQYKNIYLSKPAIELLTRIALKSKLDDNDYTQGDAVHEGLKLLAKKKGIKH